MRSRCSRRLAIPAAVLAATTVSAGIDCTQVSYERVFGVAHPEQAINIAFVGDHFTVSGSEDGLKSYRCAVRLVVDGLVRSQPFRNLSCHVNVWRVDSISSVDDVAVGSGSGCADTAPTFDIAALCDQDPGWSDTDPVPTYDFGTTIDPDDPGTDICELLIPSSAGLTEANDVADCLEGELGEIHALAILVDSGAESASALTGDRQIAVFTLDDINEADARFARLAHELGHTFGLLDEYTETSAPPPDFHCRRNVYWRCQDCDADGVPDDDPGQLFWAGACDPPPAGTRIETCASGLVDSPCGFVTCEGDCSPACGEASVTVDVGFREGGFYNECGYFRSEAQCRMADGVVDPFCASCTCYVRSVAVDGGLLECFEPSTCRSVTGGDYEIVVRDCPTDDGTEPSSCEGSTRSPDVMLRPASAVAGILDGTDISVDPSAELTVCATNVGSTAIQKNVEVYAQFYVADSSPDLARLLDGVTSPTLAEGAATVENLKARSGVPMTGAFWQIKEELCLTLPAAPQPLTLLDPPNARLYAWFWLREHPPNLLHSETADNNRAKIDLADIVDTTSVPPGSLFVRVTDEDGTPVAGATVTLTGIDSVRIAETDDDGRARFILLPPGTYTLDVVREGFVAASQSVVVTGGGLTVTVSLVPSAIS